jgi:hypothetical protein
VPPSFQMLPNNKVILNELFHPGCGDSPISLDVFHFRLQGPVRTPNPRLQTLCSSTVKYQLITPMQSHALGGVVKFEPQLIPYFRLNFSFKYSEGLVEG